MDYKRELPLAEPPAERIRHWREFHAHAAEPMLQKQGARCMD
jgi:glutamate synthase (NADPH/NADH) small chain